MEIKRLVLGMVRTNCYIAYKGKKAVIIDPAAEPARIQAAISRLALTPEAILLTHGHFDHIMAADALRKEYHIPVCVLSEEAELLSEPEKNCSYVFGAPYAISADELLFDGQKLSFLDGALSVIATPGHTVGSCCYYAEEEKLLFSGDTLFSGSVGRTDLPLALPSKLSLSIREKLFTLPEEVLVLPGHDAETTIGEEKRHNPYVV